MFQKGMHLELPDLSLPCVCVCVFTCKCLPMNATSFDLEQTVIAESLYSFEFLTMQLLVGSVFWLVIGLSLHSFSDILMQILEELENEYSVYNIEF